MSVNAAAVRENGVGRHRATTRPHAATVLVSDAGDDGPSFDVVLPRRWMTWSLLVASVFAFFVGRVCRLMLLQDVVLLRSMTTHASSLAATPVATLNRPIDSSRSALPLPVLSRNKPVPSTVYTSKHFDTSLTAKSDTILLSRAPACRDDADEVEDPTSNARTVSLLGGGERIENHSFGSFSINLDGTPVLTTLKEPHVGAEKESAHEPTGQHLLVDIENVDSEFLNSEARLADAMVTLIKVSGLTLLSYHCHGLEPTGVSCVGVLLESHVSFHTWPAEGVITLDLFTCGGRSLLPLVGYIEDLFGVPSADDSFADAPRAQWALKNRGFPHDEDLKNPEDIDLDEYLLGWIDFEMKEEVASVETDFQSIEVFDVINPRFRRLQSHKRSLTNDGSYEAQHPELFLPDRVVYLDKIMQSRRYGEKEYHEALVHPAMFAHRHPKRVAIIGGGEGATLREVLKHKTVENVTMIEIDEVMVQVSRKVLPEWSSCSDFGDGLESCFDDPRATVYYADAISWFINVFGDERSFDDDLKFDVIIMDALDPSSAVSFSDTLYSNNALISALANALGDDGVLVAQVGQSPSFGQAPRDYTRQSVLEDGFVHLLKENGFEKVKEYDEGHGGFLGVWSFMVALNSVYSNELWFANQAEVDRAIKDRMYPSPSGGSPLHFFDGSVMRTYAYPSRIIEETFCRKVPAPPLCANGHGFDPELPNAKISSFEVKNSTIPGAGRGVFFKESFKENTYLAIEVSVNDTMIQPATKRTIKDMKALTPSGMWNVWESWMFGYGFSSDFYGDSSFIVDASMLTFTNHGCNGTNNYGVRLSVTEGTASPDVMPPDLYYTEEESAIYNPYAERNHLMLIGALDVVNRDVEAGEELFDEFLKYLHEDNWKWGVEHFRTMCAGHSLGVVSGYEAGSDAGVEL